MTDRVRIVEVGPRDGLQNESTPIPLEAMKMEHVVAASLPGRLTEVRVRAGEQVVRGQLLAVVEP